MFSYKPPKVLLIEDDVVTRMGTRHVLENKLGFEVVGEASDGISAVEEARKLEPPICLVDIGLPGQDGIETTRQIKYYLPDTKIIMLTASDNDADIFSAFGAGADGYILKRALGSEMLETLDIAIRSVRFGSVFLDPQIARHVLISAFNGNSNLSYGQQQVLGTVAASNCHDGMCMVEPAFLAKLHKLAPNPPTAMSA